MALIKHQGPAWLACAALLLTGCTVVDLDAEGKPIIPPDPNAKVSYRNQTAQQVAQQTWQSKVMATANAQAPDWQGLQQKSSTLKAGASQSLFVKAQGQVTAFNSTNDREHSLSVTIEGTPVIVQLGPVIRSNAIRDAAGFKFQDFTNQVQFAQLTRALNRQAVKQLQSVDASWNGKPVELLMAVTLRKEGIEDAVALSVKQEAP